MPAGEVPVERSPSRWEFEESLPLHARPLDGIGTGSEVFDSVVYGSMLVGLDCLDITGAACVGLFESLASSYEDGNIGETGLEIVFLLSCTGG